MAEHVRCGRCGREAVEFGTHGFFTTFIVPLARWCSKCQTWVCGRCASGKRCGYCKTELVVP